MKNLSFFNRIIVASPALALLVAGTVVWDMKVLALVAIGYLFIVDFVLKKTNKEKS